MNKLSEDTVWHYIDEDRGVQHHFICNFGSKNNFLKLIQSVKWVIPNWVRQRITESSNEFQVKLSKENPNSFIYYTTTGRWNNEGFEIIKIINK